MSGRIEKAAPIFGAVWTDCNEDGLLDLARARWNHAVDVQNASGCGRCASVQNAGSRC